VHVPSVSFDKRFFAREHGARAYSSTAWHLSWLIKLALTAAIKLILYTPCFYFLGQLRLDFTAYAAAAFATGGMSFAGSAVALCLAAVIPSLGAASTAFGSAVLLYQNVCGFFLPISAIPPYLIWLAWSSIFTYGYHAIINSQQLGSAMTGGGGSIQDRQVRRPPRVKCDQVQTHTSPGAVENGYSTSFLGFILSSNGLTPRPPHGTFSDPLGRTGIDTRPRAARGSLDPRTQYTRVGASSVEWPRHKGEGKERGAAASIAFTRARAAGRARTRR
jgi:hypothetical protein